MPLIKHKTTKIGDYSIDGEIRFSAFIESGGKRTHENVYIVDISIPKKSNGWLQIKHSLIHQIFQDKKEAIDFFDLEYKKIIKQRKEAK